jgi:hypothetical protein
MRLTILLAVNTGNRLEQFVVGHLSVQIQHLFHRRVEAGEQHILDYKDSQWASLVRVSMGERQFEQSLVTFPFRFAGPLPP